MEAALARAVDTLSPGCGCRHAAVISGKGADPASNPPLLVHTFLRDAMEAAAADPSLMRGRDGRGRSSAAATQAALQQLLKTSCVTASSAGHPPGARLARAAAARTTPKHGGRVVSSETALTPIDIEPVRSSYARQTRLSLNPARLFANPIRIRREDGGGKGEKR